MEDNSETLLMGLTKKKMFKKNKKVPKNMKGINISSDKSYLTFGNL